VTRIFRPPIKARTGERSSERTFRPIRSEASKGVKWSGNPGFTRTKGADRLEAILTMS